MTISDIVVGKDYLDFGLITLFFFSDGLENKNLTIDLGCSIPCVEQVLLASKELPSCVRMGDGARINGTFVRNKCREQRDCRKEAGK